jgi:hypothetical protein
MTVLAIDPGYRQSAYVAYDGVRIQAHGIVKNEELLEALGPDVLVRPWPSGPDLTLVIEEMQLFKSSFGVGKEIFDSVFWSGRFAQAWHPRPFDRILRSRVRGHLQCGKGGDSAVRQALIDRFGPYKETAIGKKASPGPLFGIRADEWSALAIAVTWTDQQQIKAVAV